MTSPSIDAPDATLVIRLPTGAVLTVDQWADGASRWRLRCACAMSVILARPGEGDRDVMRRLVRRHRDIAPACAHVRAGGWGKAGPELHPWTLPATEAAVREGYVVPDPAGTDT